MKTIALPCPTAALPGRRRRAWGRQAVIAVAVVALHAGLIYLFQNGQSLRPAERLLPASVQMRWVAPPEPPVAPRPVAAVQPPPPAAPPKPAIRPAAPAMTKPPAPRAAEARTLPAAPTEATSFAIASPAAPSITPALPGPAAAPSPAPTSATAVSVQLPSSDADYLQNPKPDYPPLSRRLGEAGKVVHKVWIGADGKPQRAELVSSSGYPRLDRAAYETVMRWRYVPGKRNGQPETMAFQVPINWELTQ